MAEITAEWLEAETKKVLALFEDGFQYSDLFKIVPMVMETVELVQGLSGPEKKATAISLANEVIDRTDMPWIPDALVDPIIKQFVPGAIESLIEASRGGFSFGKKEDV